MSVNLPTSESLPSNDLDLNSDAAPLDDLTEISRVSTTKSPITVSLPHETLIITENDQIRVSELAGDEWTSNKEAVLADVASTVSITDSAVTTTSVTEKTLVESGSDVARVSGEGNDLVKQVVQSVDEARVSGVDDVNMECSTLKPVTMDKSVETKDEVVRASRESVRNADFSTEEPIPDDDQARVVQVAEMNSRRVVVGERMTLNAVQENLNVAATVECSTSEIVFRGVSECMDTMEDGNLDTYGVGEVKVSGVGDDLVKLVAVESTYGDFSNGESIPVRDEMRPRVVQVGEMDSYQVDFDQRMDGNVIEENLNDADCVKEDSNSVAGVDEPRATVECVALYNMNMIDFHGVRHFMESPENGNLDMQDIEPEKVAPVAERISNQVLKVVSSASNPDTLVEQTQGFDAVVRVGDSLEARCDASETDAVDSAEALGGSPKSLQHQDSSPENDDAMQDIEPEKVSPVAETTSNQVGLGVRLDEEGIIEAARVGTSVLLAETLVDQTDSVVEGEAVAMDVEECSEERYEASQTNALVDGLGRSPSLLQHQDIFHVDDSSMQATKPEEVFHEEARNTDGVSNINAMNLNQADAGGRNLAFFLHEDPSPPQTYPLQDMEPKEVVPTAETASCQVEPEVPVTKCHTSEYEGQKPENELVKERSSIYITRKAVEQIQIVAGEELVVMDAELAKSRGEVSEINTVAVSDSLKSLSHEGIFQKKNTSVQDIELDKVSETTSNEINDKGRVDSHPIEEKPNKKAYFTCLRAVAGATDGPEFMGSCASLHGRDVPDSVLGTESVLPLPEKHTPSNFNCTKVDDREVEEQKFVVGDVNIGCSTVLLESNFEKTEEVIEGQVMLMNKEQVSEIKDEISENDAMDEKHSFMEIDPSLETGVLDGRIESDPNEHLSYKEDTFMQDEKQDKVVQVVETVSNLLDAEELMDSEPLNKGLYITINSKSLTKVTEQSVPAVFSGSLSKSDLGYTPIDKSVGPLENGSADSKTQVAKGNVVGYEQMKNETESIVITELLAEQIQVVTVNEVAGVEDEEVTEMQHEVLGADPLDGKSSMGGNPILGAEGAIPDSESLPNMSLTDEVLTSAEDEKQMKVCQVADTVFCQVDGDERMHTHPIEGNLDETIVKSNSAVESVDGSQATGACASLSGNTKPGQFADPNLDSEVNISGGHTSLLDKERTVSSYLSEANTVDVGISQTVEVAETETAVGSSRMTDFQGVASNGSELGVSDISSNDKVMTGLDDNCPRIDDKLNTGDVFVDDTSLLDDSSCEIAKTKEMRNCMESCESDRLDENAPERESQFSEHDLVWGKVKSHPWWPGQIFHSSDASQRAMKYQKKGSYLVAYFGDQTFAWNHARSLKPFLPHFSQMEKQSSSESFRSAVLFALDEVSRRVELGMVCSCTPKEAYAKIKSQNVVNAGIREKARRRDGIDKSLAVDSFEPTKLVRNIKALALSPYGVGDKLELAIAQAQLLAFYRLKGYPQLPGFNVFGGLVENDLVNSLSGAKHPQYIVNYDIPTLQSKQASSGKEKLKRRYNSRKHKDDSDDGVYSSRKERSLSELMAGKKASHLVNGKSVSSSGKKRKAFNSFSDDSNVKSRKHLSPSGDVDMESPAPQSFKIGDCLRRIASQLTGAPPILKCSGERFQKTAIKVDPSSEKPDLVGGSPQTQDESHRGGRVAILTEYSSSDENLLHLRLAAQDPKKRYTFLTKVIDYFTRFRNSISIDNSRRKKQKRSDKMSDGRIVCGIREPSIVQTNSNKTFDFEEMSDSYWTDRIIQSSPEDQPSHRNRTCIGESQIETPMEMDSLSFEADHSLLLDPALDSEKHNLDGDPELVIQRPTRKYQRRKRKTQPDVDDNATLGSKRHNLGAGTHAEQAVQDFNENNYVDEFCPTALVMSFTDADSLPSATKLNRIFSRFGPLKESQTEVLTESNSARVVFKKLTDAEIALSSAGKFGIFGHTPVNYELSYLSSTTCKAYSVPAPQVRQDATSVEDYTTGLLEGYEFLDS